MKSLEKYALEYLERETSEIENSGRKNVLPMLTTYEKATILKYSSRDGFQKVNELLRKSKGTNLTEFGHLLQESLSKLDNFEGLVYRGVFLLENELKLYSDALNANSVFKEYSFISTSKSRSIALAFGGNVLFRMFSRTGKDIEPISKYGKFGSPNEKEVLFIPNVKFRILDISNEVSYSLITMEETS